MIKKFESFVNENKKPKEIIESIKEWEGEVEVGGQHPYDAFVEGYLMTTSEKEYKFVISNSDACCEQWGYFMSEDNLEEFVGSELINVEVVDTALNVSELRMEDELGSSGLQEGGVMFVNVNTSVGLLQFVAYNSHNGYYGHDAFLIVDDVTKETRSL